MKALSLSIHNFPFTHGNLLKAFSLSLLKSLMSLALYPSPTSPYQSVPTHTLTNEEFSIYTSIYLSTYLFLSLIYLSLSTLSLSLSLYLSIYLSFSFLPVRTARLKAFPLTLKQIPNWGVRYLTGENLKVVWAEFSILS